MLPSVLRLIAGLCCTAHLLRAAAPDVVVCPRALNDFRDPSSLRADYQAVLADPEAWPEVFRRTTTIKFYVANLAPEVGLNLPRLVAMAERGGFKAEFEVGGLRPQNAADFTHRSGEEQAEKEIRLLRRWVEAGGRVDALTTDHAIMHQMSRNYRDRDEFTKKTIVPGEGGMFEIEALMGELMDYFAAMQAEFPGVRFGVIESLGYFHVRSAWTEYPAADPRLPRWDFESFLDQLLAAAAARGVRIEWFDLDFGFLGSAQDTLRAKSRRLDVGRTLAAADLIRKKGLLVGIIYNDDGRIQKDFLPGDPGRRDPARNRFAFENTRDYWRATRTQARPGRILFQSWFPYPEKTGPESAPYSFFHAARELLTMGK